MGYSYKNFFECGVAIEKGPILQDFHFKAITDMVEKRRRKVYSDIKTQAIISACQATIGGINYLITTPREDDDTLIFYKLSLKA